MSNVFNFYAYVDDPNNWLDLFGLAKSYQQKKDWNNARRKYWKDEAKANPNKYSKKNLDRMKKGGVPQIEDRVKNNRTNKIETKIYSMELHHKKPQRKGGSNKKSNLEEVTPWKHDEKDKYRHTGNKLLEITTDIGSF